MDCEILLQLMFPRDKDKALPSFKGAGAAIDGQLMCEVNGLLNSFLLVNEKEGGEAITWELEPNTLLRELKRINYQLVDRFILLALEAYYSAPSVLAVVNAGRVVLFPHHSFLPEIDYDLLEGVLEHRGIAKYNDG